MTVSCPQLGRVGRLKRPGNQLYELAATLGITHARGEDACLPEDWDYRPWFSVPDQLFGRNCTGTPASDLVPHLDPRARDYLQDYRLFADIMPTLREYLSPSPVAQAVLAEHDEFWDLPRPVLAVHVRRGDNVPGADPGHPVGKHLFHPCPPLAYYMLAIEVARQTYGEAGTVAVFSDDPDWCEQHIPADYYQHGVVRAKEHLPQYHTEPALDWIDWFLLASCSAFVLSNSTFGWMAAMIAGGPAIVPTPIYGPALDFLDESILFPSTWTRLSREAVPC